MGFLLSTRQFQWTGLAGIDNYKVPHALVENAAPESQPSMIRSIQAYRASFVSSNFPLLSFLPFCPLFAGEERKDLAS